MSEAAISLDGKRVIVIGGASGIGFAVATLAKELGAEVVIASRNAAKVEAAVARLPGATGRIVDLRDEASVSGFFETLGAFDHLVSTAGDCRMFAWIFSALTTVFHPAARQSSTRRMRVSVAAMVSRCD